MSHIILAPSKASRWLACPPSARLEAQIADTPGPSAQAGTLAHKLAEAILSHKLGQLTTAQYNNTLTKIQNNKHYNTDMHNHANDYTNFVLNKYNEAKTRSSDTIIQIETKIDLTNYIPQGIGTCDAIIISNGTMDIIDLKFGRGIRIESKNNKQMMLYALGAFLKFGYPYNIHNIKMTIYQPRIKNFSTSQMPIKNLLLWAGSELTQKAKLAYQGKGQYSAGRHCTLCRAKATCTTYANHQLNLTKQKLNPNNKLSDQQILNILNKAGTLRAWLKSVEQYALSQAINNNKQWLGLKLIQTKGKEQYTDDQAVIKRLLSNGYKRKDILQIKPLPITTMEKIISKKTFNKLLGDLITRNEGKKALVPTNKEHPN